MSRCGNISTNKKKWTESGPVLAEEFQDEISDMMVRNMKTQGDA
jgi:hypothetical protein